jgi:hypothetical protein
MAFDKFDWAAALKGLAGGATGFVEARTEARDAARRKMIEDEVRRRQQEQWDLEKAGILEEQPHTAAMHKLERIIQEDLAREHLPGLLGPKLEPVLPSPYATGQAIQRRAAELGNIGVEQTVGFTPRVQAETEARWPTERKLLEAQVTETLARAGQHERMPTERAPGANTEETRLQGMLDKEVDNQQWLTWRSQDMREAAKGAKDKKLKARYEADATDMDKQLSDSKRRVGSLRERLKPYERGTTAAADATDEWVGYVNSWNLSADDLERTLRDENNLKKITADGADVTTVLAAGAAKVAALRAREGPKTGVVERYKNWAIGGAR